MGTPGQEEATAAPDAFMEQKESLAQQPSPLWPMTPEGNHGFDLRSTGHHSERASQQRFTKVQLRHSMASRGSVLGHELLALSQSL